MQAFTYMKDQPSLSIPAVPARERLLAAARLVFARDGLQGATTRAIASEAGVNEVTLFRLFQNKDGLLAEVMEAIVRRQQEAASVGDAREWTGNLKTHLRRYAENYYALLTQEETLIRTMIGEARRYPDAAKQIILDAAKPERARFIASLEAARKAGLVRRGVDLAVAADAFTGMLLAGMLRLTADCAEGYSAEEFVAMCVNLFAAGLAASAA